MLVRKFIFWQVLNAKYVTHYYTNFKRCSKILRWNYFPNFCHRIFRVEVSGRTAVRARVTISLLSVVSNFRRWYTKSHDIRTNFKRVVTHKTTLFRRTFHLVGRFFKITWSSYYSYFVLAMIAFTATQSCTVVDDDTLPIMKLPLLQTPSFVRSGCRARRRLGRATVPAATHITKPSVAPIPAAVPSPIVAPWPGIYATSASRIRDSCARFASSVRDGPRTSTNTCASGTRTLSLVASTSAELRTFLRRPERVRSKEKTPWPTSFIPFSILACDDTYTAKYITEISVRYFNVRISCSSNWYILKKYLSQMLFYVENNICAKH